MIHYFQPEGYKKYYVCSDNEVDEPSEEEKPKNDYKNFLLFDDLQESTSESDSDFSLSNDETISESEVEELVEDMKKHGEGYKKDYELNEWINDVDESSEEDKPKNIEQQQIQPSQQQMESARLGPLPPGWEQREINGGEIYFINHHEKKSTWFDPRVPIDSQRIPHRISQGQDGGQTQNYYNESSEENKPKNDYKNCLLFDDLQESTSESDSDFSCDCDDETISDTSSSESEVEELMEDLKKILKKK